MASTATAELGETERYEALLAEAPQHFGGLKIGRPGRSRAYHWIVGGMIRPFLMLIRPWQRIRMVGAKNIPATGPVILVSNHESFMDPIVVVAKAWRPFAAFAKLEHFHGKSGWFYRGMGQIPLERGNPTSTEWTLAMGTSILRLGGAVCIYPEATRKSGIVCRYFGRMITPLLESCPDTPLVPLALTYEKRRFGKTVVIRVGEPRCYDGDIASDGDRIMKELRLWTAEAAGMPTTSESARDVKRRSAGEVRREP